MIAFAYAALVIASLGALGLLLGIAVLLDAFLAEEWDRHLARCAEREITALEAAVLRVEQARSLPAVIGHDFAPLRSCAGASHASPFRTETAKAHALLFIGEQLGELADAVRASVPPEIASKW